MNRIVTAVIVGAWGLLVPAVTHAQEHRLHFGVVGGSNLSNVAWHPQPDFRLDRLHHLNGGLLANIRLTDVVSFETRVMWLRQGVDAVVSSAPRIQVSYLFDSAAVPMLLRAGATTGRIRPYVLAGPQLAFKTRAVAVSDVVGERSEEALTDDDVKSVDVALNAGGGIELPAGRTSLFVEAVYSRGLRNLAVLQAGDDSSVSVKSRTVLFSVGVRF